MAVFLVLSLILVKYVLLFSSSSNCVVAVVLSFSNPAITSVIIVVTLLKSVVYSALPANSSLDSPKNLSVAPVSFPTALFFSASVPVLMLLTKLSTSYFAFAYCSTTVSVELAPLNSAFL